MKNTKIAMGTVIPLGDGSVGKTVMLQMLLNKGLSEEDRVKILNDASKSKNIEMEFGAEKLENGDTTRISIQYYNFPGQIQKESARTVTFDEILHIFQFLPALSLAHVILLMYDANRIYTLKSLENWVSVAIKKEWISTQTKILLISNKIDIQPPNTEFIEEVRSGIVNYIQSNGIEIQDDQVVARSSSCMTYEGIDTIRQDIIAWIAQNGIKRG